MQFGIVTQPPIRVAAIRHVGSYQTISEAFARLGDVAGATGMFGPGIFMLGLYHDDPRTTPESELRSDAAIMLRDGAGVPPGLAEITLAGGRYARTTHNGPYDGLPAAWGEMMAWLERSSERPGEGISYEVYRNDPSNTPPEKLVTDILMPLA